MRKIDPRFLGLIAAATLASGAADAADLVAARNIRVGTIITEDDITLPANDDAARAAKAVIGLQASRAIFRGEPLSRAQLKAPSLVTRNTLVTMEFTKGALVISAEGRALDEGALGDEVRVMNLASKRIVSAVVAAQNLVRTKQ